MKKDTRKPGTIIAELKRENNSLRELAARYLGDWNKCQIRATKLERELADWKRRFDLLLARTPEVGPGHPSEPSE